MGEQTGIQWCHHTANTWWGCTKVSDGCKFCYADGEAKRRGFNLWGPQGSRRMIKSVWNDVKKWAKAAAAAGERRRVFWGSMMDVCEDRPELEEPRQRFCAIVEELEDLDFLILTKRPENYVRLMPWGKEAWPKNAWAGTSAENQATFDARVKHLAATPAGTHWMSLEPLLGPISFMPHGYYDPDHLASSILDWAIVGGESGPHARPFDIAWAQSLRDQCKAGGVAFFMKQMGAKPFQRTKAFPDGEFLSLSDKKGGDISAWPEDLRLREFPKVVARG